VSFFIKKQPTWSLGVSSRLKSNPNQPEHHLEPAIQITSCEKYRNVKQAGFVQLNGTEKEKDSLYLSSWTGTPHSSSW
jgi:hypothetical protein